MTEESSTPTEDESSELEDDELSDEGLLDRPTTFTLNGQTWSFDNPVSLVLAAARQLGMAIGRDARLLWIADEALLDQHEEEDVDQMRDRLPENPLSDEIAAHYTELFLQRSASLAARLEPARSPMQALGEVAAAETPRLNKARTRAERRRRRLALREARLSGITEITERQTGEVAPLRDVEDVEEPCSPEPSPSSLHSTAAAVWPPDVALLPSHLRLHSSLPRIDSSPVGLDQLVGGTSEHAADGCIESVRPPDLLAAQLSDRLTPAPAAALPSASPIGCVPTTFPPLTTSGAHGLETTCRELGARAEYQQTFVKERPGGQLRAAHDGASSAECRTPMGDTASWGCTDAVRDRGDGFSPAPAEADALADLDDVDVSPFRVGDRVEVDFDTDGWFGGVVSSVEGAVYSVQLDSGEMAHDVEGSEIREERGGRRGGTHGHGHAGRGLDGTDGENGEGSSSASHDDAHTRSDMLSAFGSALDLAALAPEPLDEADARMLNQPTMGVRVTSAGVEWIVHEASPRPTWSPPTVALLKALDGTARRCAEHPPLATLQDYFKAAEEEC